MSYADDMIEDLMFQEYMYRNDIEEFVEGFSDQELTLQVTRLMAILPTEEVGEMMKDKIDNIISFGVRRGYLTEKQRYALGEFIYINVT